jgi:C-terminal processing protease CtpA/Prc
MTNNKNLAILTAFAALAISCAHPVYDGPLDLAEQQSVWQYLSVYSIYQEKLPDESGDLTPTDLFRMIADTLRGAYYTSYTEERLTPADALASRALDNRDAAFKVTDSTVYLRLSEFSDITLAHFKAWRFDILRSSPYIVVDVRGNLGGNLAVTDSIVWDFLPAGSEFIRTRYREYDSRNRIGKTIEWTNLKSAKSPGLEGKKISVIMDNWSASASEILASAFKDCLGAHLVGGRSYGKGMGQVIVPRMGRNTLSITFMQIRGVSERTGDYHRKGIAPDPVPGDIASQSAKQPDPDLYVAVKLLEKSAPDAQITAAAREIQNSGLLKKSAWRNPEAYLLVDEDFLE